MGNIGSASNPKPEINEVLSSKREAIYNYILSIMRDPNEAEDLTQDTLVRAHGKLGTLKDHEKIVPWLYQIATNICRDRFRQTSFQQRPQSLDTETFDGSELTQAEALEDHALRLDKVLEQREMSSCVQKYVSELTDSYRAVILLHDCEGLTNSEIADMLGASLSTVKIRLHRARKKLREALNNACSFSCDERGVVICEPKSEDLQG